MTEFLRDFQVIIAALVALGAAFVAYDGVTAAVIDSQRKEQINQQEICHAHYIRIVEEIDDSSSWLMVGCNTLLRLLGSNEAGSCLALGEFMSRDFQSLREAFRDISLFPVPIRQELTKAHARLRSMHNTAENMRETKYAIDDDMRNAMITGAAAGHVNFIRSVTDLHKLLRAEVRKAGIDETQMWEYQDEIIRPPFAQLQQAVLERKTSSN